MTVYVIETDENDRAVNVETFCCCAAVRDHLVGETFDLQFFFDQIEDTSTEVSRYFNEQLDYACEHGRQMAERECAHLTPEELVNVREYFAEMDAEKNDGEATTSAERTETAGVR